MNKHDEQLLCIWRSLTPAQRDYDRFVARRVPHCVPPLERGIAETAGGAIDEAAMRDPSNDERGCSCHLTPPCDFCLSLTEEEADAFWSGGMSALRILRNTQSQ